MARPADAADALQLHKEALNEMRPAELNSVLAALQRDAYRADGHRVTQCAKYIRYLLTKATPDLREIVEAKREVATEKATTQSPKPRQKKSNKNATHKARKEIEKKKKPDGFNSRVREAVSKATKAGLTEYQKARRKARKEKAEQPSLATILSASVQKALADFGESEAAPKSPPAKKAESEEEVASKAKEDPGSESDISDV
eukprot:CAMPEP_0184671714 /NCGR_PEP_ID=MMETSP0308-20130426/85666_1 /TAXON_ID=38269 /ORGANISM="Gloeochaete witrockiana, Strain SAG 46.84" /LENGTH=200 /DNA_ID=CAMNT_0027118897 /DNA_START=1074 /DNA_END=1676 /DNA_ORIENTATION=-